MRATTGLCAHVDRRTAHWTVSTSIHPYVPVDTELLHIRLERLLQRLFAAGEGSVPSSPTAAAAAAVAPVVPAAGVDDMAKSGDEDEKPVGAIEESGGAAAAATVPAVATAAAAARVKSEV